MITRIDPASAHKIHLILAQCRVRGTDPVAALDAAGHLSYPSRRLQEAMEELQELHDILAAMTPTMLGDGIVPATAADMKRCILETIKRRIS